MPRRRPRGCQEVVELVTDFMEGALTPAVRSRLDTHLRVCRHCASYLRQMQAMVAAARRIAAPALDRRHREELVVAYRRWTAA